MRVAPFAALCLVVLTLACAGSRANPELLEAHFVESEYAPYQVSGTGSIGGQAYLRLADGRAIFAAGDEVRLIPATAYTREWIEKGVARAHFVDELDPRLEAVIRRAWGDGTGFFEFRDLPAGGYFILCEIDWKEDGPYGGGLASATLHREVELADGERIALVVLTR